MPVFIKLLYHYEINNCLCIIIVPLVILTSILYREDISEDEQSDDDDDILNDGVEVADDEMYEEVDNEQE